MKTLATIARNSVTAASTGTAIEAAAIAGNSVASAPTRFAKQIEAMEAAAGATGGRLCRRAYSPASAERGSAALKAKS